MSIKNIKRARAHSHSKHDHVICEPSVVVGAIIVREGRILLAQRDCVNFAGKWEFPGGKVESGETKMQALVREIVEELGVEVQVICKVASNNFSVSQKIYSLHCYWCEIVNGEPIAKERNNLMWLYPRDLLSVDLVPADIPIAREVMKHDW